MSLSAYTGPWTKSEATHLLKRTVVGYKKTHINWSVANGLNATISALMNLSPDDFPVAYNNDDPMTSVGATWVNNLYPDTNSALVDAMRRVSLTSWANQKLYSGEMTIKEKMTLFWLNHFGVRMEHEPNIGYQYISLIRNSCLGNFKQLVKDMTVNPEMLLFLSGAFNNQFFPNENFARELFELYTIGKGPQIGPGDYTNYTEDDILAASRVLTGWTIENYAGNVSQGSVAQSVFMPILHDTGTKQFTEKFNNIAITNNGENEYKDLIDMIFLQDEVARHISRKLYRWFVNYDITPAVNTNIIIPLADIIIANNYDITQAVSTLLSSQHFFSEALRGTLVKDPCDFMATMFVSTNTNLDYDLLTRTELFYNLHWVTASSGMNIAAPSEVAGWYPFFLAPAYSQLWINSARIRERSGFAFFIIFNGQVINGQTIRVDTLGFLNSMDFPNDDLAVVMEIESMFCCKPMSTSQRLYLRTLLHGGQGSAVWTMEYQNYQSNPDNTTQANLIRTRMNTMLAAFFRMAEFHVI
jgi:uncharacterized protein (DUF1800 family)